MSPAKPGSHEVIRYQPYRQRKGIDLACRCGRRWHLQESSRDYAGVVEAVALHFDWGEPEPGRLRNWLETKLPAKLKPQDP